MSIQQGAQKILDTPRDERPATLTDDVIHGVVRNDHQIFFTLGSREFPYKDLAYDDYIEFCAIIAPFVEQIFSTAKPKIVDKDGQPELDFDFDTTSLDPKTLVRMGAEALPKLAWLCCRQSDETISIKDVKRLAGGKPWPLLSVVFKQVKHNKIVEDVIAFFPQLGELAGDLIPDLAVALTKAR